MQASKNHEIPYLIWIQLVFQVMKKKEEKTLVTNLNTD